VNKKPNTSTHSCHCQCFPPGSTSVHYTDVRRHTGRLHWSVVSVAASPCCS